MKYVIFIFTISILQFLLPSTYATVVGAVSFLFIHYLLCIRIESLISYNASLFYQKADIESDINNDFEKDYLTYSSVTTDSSRNLRLASVRDNTKTSLVEMIPSVSMPRFLEGTASVGVAAGSLRLVGLMIIAPIWFTGKLLQCTVPFLEFSWEHSVYGVCFWFETASECKMRHEFQG